jgi:hypothetical protein
MRLPLFLVTVGKYMDNIPSRVARRVTAWNRDGYPA